MKAIIFKHLITVSVAAMGFLGSSAAQAAGTAVKLALPAQSMLFSPYYVAADKGYFAEQGLDVTMTVVAGPGTLNAVVSGSADFGFLAGGIVLAAASKGQVTKIIGNTQDTFSTELVLSKAAVDKLTFKADAPNASRALALKGLTIGVDAVGGLPHSYLRFVAKTYGVDADTDMTVSPLQPPAMVAALKQGRIDGFTFSQPFTLQAVNDGGVLWFSGVRGDVPNLAPHVYNSVFVRPTYCNDNAANCTKFMAAVNKALALIKNDPESAFESIKKVFGTMPADLLRQSFDVSVKLAPAKADVTEKAMFNTISFDRKSGILPADAALPPTEQLFDNQFNK